MRLPLYFLRAFLSNSCKKVESGIQALRQEGGTAISPFVPSKRSAKTLSWNPSSVPECTKSFAFSGQLSSESSGHTLNFFLGEEFTGSCGVRNPRIAHVRSWHDQRYLSSSRTVPEREALPGNTNLGTESSQNSSASSGFWQHKHKLWGEEDGGEAGLVTPAASSSQPSYFHATPTPPKERALAASELSTIRQRPRGDDTLLRHINNGVVAAAAAASEAQREYYIPVKAFYIARSLDFKGLLEGPFKNYPSHLVRNNVVVRFPDRTNGPASNSAGASGMAAVPFLSERYMVAFQYGSVVFLNFGSSEQEQTLEALLPFCSDHFSEARKDDYGVVLRPSLAGWSEGGHDHIMVKQLDISNIRVIASVLGQSVALEFYAKKVDEMVTTFSELNRGMEKTGTFTMKRKKLFQLVAAANTTLADVILRLGLLERSDTAWKHARYAKIWEYLRDDFELDERFENLDFKLNIIQHNVRFFLDILQNRKSDTLEWIIILLIAGEICVSLYEIISTAMKTSQAHAAVSVPVAGSMMSVQTATEGIELK